MILPTYNRVDRLRRVLESLERQQDPNADFDVVVISDGSTDGTSAFMATYDSSLRVHFVQQPNGGAAAARNTGLRHATGAIVLFIDDDVVPAPDLVRQHITSHVDDDLVVLGPMLSPPDFAMQPWVRWEQAMLMKQYDDMTQANWVPTARQFYTGNSSVARRWLVEAGGFDTSFRRAEDVELGYRLADRGVRFVFNERAIGWHYAERSFTSWLDTPYQYGRNDVVFARDKAQHWLMPTMRKELRTRHPLIRLLVHSCLDRRIASRAALSSLRLMSHVPGLSRITHSSMFNLRYYQGVADELGGRGAFFALRPDSGSPASPTSGAAMT